MSSIKDILEKTNKNTYVITSTYDDFNIVVEGGGEYKGYYYLVVFTDLGHRCGYVSLPKEYPSKINIDDIECHGGITFCKNHHKLKSHFKVYHDDIWIGFDCAHWDDEHDIFSLERYFGSNFPLVKIFKNNDYLIDVKEIRNVKSFDFVVSECMKIIDQL